MVPAVNGIAVTGSPAGAAGLRELTPQRRHIIKLAAEGLSNREIAQRLFLSPRTVASHLYRSFPKLGIAGRHQLHGLLAQADHSATAVGRPDRCSHHADTRPRPGR